MAALRAAGLFCIVICGLAVIPGSTVVYDDEDDDFHVHVVVNGSWGVECSGSLGDRRSLYIEASDGAVWGRWTSGGSEEIEGTTEGSFISFYWTTGDTTVTHTGTISGDTMHGAWVDTDNHSGTWSAERD